MGIFSRRNIKRILDENRQFLTKKQLRDHVKHLNGADEVRRVATEWEVVILNALNKVGSVTHEPKLPGATKIDALFGHATGTALIEITAVSDRGLDEQNPVELLSEELTRRVREHGLNPNHFGLEVKGNSHELFLGGPRPHLYIPPSDQLEKRIFNSAFYQFVDTVRTSGSKKFFSPALEEPGAVKIHYDPAQKFFSCNYLDYTVPFSVHSNPLYNRLWEKTQQLEKSQHKALKGIVVCDSGCSVLRRTGRRGMDVDADEIISTFLAKHTSIAFVLTIVVTSERSLSWSPADLRIGVKAHISPSHGTAGPLVSLLRDSFREQLPKPENIPMNAHSLQSSGRSFNGGGTMSGGKIKMSARAVLGLLSGHIKQEDFLRENQPFANAFDKIVRDGRLLEAVSIDHCPERDDDWIEFSFSDPDAAVARFRRRRESTGA
jgi:hypothetical protein